MIGQSISHDEIISRENLVSVLTANQAISLDQLAPLNRFSNPDHFNTKTEQWLSD